MLRRTLSAGKNSRVFSKRFKSRAPQSPAEYCLDLVKRLDHENYMCTLLIRNGENRRASFAIRAFNAELASIRDQVSTAEIGRGRIVFWRQTINQVYQGSAPQHPVAKELLRLVSPATASSLNRQWFFRLIDSREANVKDSAFVSVNAAETYAENSCSPVYYLTLESLGMKSIECDHTASHLGKAQGLANLIRGVPYNASKGRCYLPLDLMAKHKLSQERLLKTSESNLHEVIFEVASVANLHLEKAQQEMKKLPNQVHDLFLPLVCLKEFLFLLQKAEFNVFDLKVQTRHSSLPWKLFKTRVKQNFRLWP